MGVLLFSTGSAMRRYLAARPAVTAHIDDGDHAVIVEGTADVTSDRELLTRALDSYNPKYNEKVTVETVGEMIVVRPAVVFAWKVEHGASFVDEATRFTFGVTSASAAAAATAELPRLPAHTQTDPDAR